MFVQFTPKQIIRQWNELWPLIREGMPLEYMRDKGEVGTCRALLSRDVSAYAVMEQGARASAKEALAVLLTTWQTDRFNGVLTLYVYAYYEREPLEREMAKTVVETMIKAVGEGAEKGVTINGIASHAHLGSLEPLLPVKEKFAWRLHGGGSDD